MADTTVHLSWTGEDLVFEGGAADGPSLVLDGDGEAGPSPVQALLLSLAACMGADVRYVMKKSRVPLESLEIDIEADRASDHPRRVTHAVLSVRTRGVPEDAAPKLQRAVDLSRDRYCSVLHSLRPDMELDIRVERL